MGKRKFTVRISLVALITGLTLITAITILSVSASFYRNSINWVIETFAQRLSNQLIHNLVSQKLRASQLGKIERVIHSFEVSPNSKIILLDRNDKIVVLSEREEGKLLPVRYQNRRIPITQVDDPFIKESFEKYLKNIKKKQRVLLKRKFDHYDFWHDLRKYTAIYRKFNLSANDIYTIAIIYPYRDFFSSFTRNNIILLSLSAFFVLLAIYSAVYLSRIISGPLTLLTQETRKIKNFDLNSPIKVYSSLIEVDNMSDAFENMRTGLRSFKKYVPSDLVQQLISMKKEAVLGGEKKRLTIFFSDIEGFTSISEKLPAEELVALLSEYLGEITENLIEHKATVDKYIGDAVMAFWGAPSECSDHAIQGCAAALAFQKRLVQINAQWREQGKIEFFTRIGINTGEVVVGNIGYENRMDYTAIGDAVNLASRIESLNKLYGTSILVGEQTQAEVRHLFELRLVDLVVVKGKEDGVKLYELIGPKGEGDRVRLMSRDVYEEALICYLRRDFNMAKKHFEKAWSLYAENGPSCQIFIERIHHFLKSPPDDDWKGLSTAPSK